MLRAYFKHRKRVWNEGTHWKKKQTKKKNPQKNPVIMIYYI